MAGHDRKKQVRSANVGRRLLVGMGAGAGVFFAAAAMATGSAAPAKADFEELLDPIIQPILTSLTDSIGAFDPAAALDLTSWTDSFLASLNSIDLALPSAAEPAASAAVPAAAEPAAAATIANADLPITVQIDTEPTVGATVDGASNTLLVDTGSSGLVIPWESLGSNDFTALENLFTLGSPVTFGESGFSGGVEYFYLEYDNVPIDYDTTAGPLDTTAPVEVEIFSFPTSFTSPANFEAFLADDHSTGILGIGDGASGGAGVSPLEAAGATGVTVNIPAGELQVGFNGGTPIETLPSSGATPDAGLTEVVTTSTGQSVGTGTVADDIDSGGVYGTIPSSISSTTLAQGDIVKVYDGNTELYQYTVGTDTDGTNEAPGLVSGNKIDSGIEPFLTHPVYLDYIGHTLSIDK
jgi:hypothetical protein